MGIDVSTYVVMGVPLDLKPTTVERQVFNRLTGEPETEKVSKEMYHLQDPEYPWEMTDEEHDEYIGAYVVGDIGIVREKVFGKILTSLEDVMYGPQRERLDVRDWDIELEGEDAVKIQEIAKRAVGIYLVSSAG